MVNNSIIGVIGRDHSYKFRIDDEDGNVVDIATAKLIFSVKLKKSETTYTFQRMNAAAGGGDAEISLFTNGSDGLLLVHVVVANTEDLEPDQYHFEITTEISGRLYPSIVDTFLLEKGVQ